MGLYELFLVCLGAVLAALSVLSQVELWQRKEYRWDRFWTYVRSDEWFQSHAIIFAATAVCLDVSWLLFLGEKYEVANVFGWLTLLVFAAHHGSRILRRGVFRPILTEKGLLVMAATSFLALAYWYFLLTPLPLVLPVATLIFVIPVFVALAVSLVNFITYPRRKSIIQAAKQKRASLADVRVVGITGSYGKTSTKIYLDHILKKAGVPHAVTREHRNSELAVAQDMLSQLKPGLEVYAAEMGAYRGGEIRDLVELVQPQIGVLTAIGNQHVALFGSPRQLAAAKWELIDGLPAAGAAILNADDVTVAQRGALLKRPKVVWYSMKHKATVYVSQVMVTADSVSAEIHLGAEAEFVTMPLVGGWRLSGVLAAVAAARELGVNATVIFKALETLPGIARTMELRSHKNYIVIDDSYSANEAGVIAAIGHLKHWPEPKIIVITPLIELGLVTAAAHQRIGEALAHSRSKIFVAGKHGRQDILAGLKKTRSKPDIVFVSDPEDLARRVAVSITPGAVILLEGRVPDVVRKSLIK